MRTRPPTLAARVGYEREANETGFWVEAADVERLVAMRRPGESLSGRACMSERQLTRRAALLSRRGLTIRLAWLS